MPPPEPSLNGGLYTGVKFAGPWGNVPVIPDSGYMIHHNLKSSNPPPGAIYQYPGSIRPGNSYINMYGIQRYQDKSFNIYCIKDDEKINNMNNYITNCNGNKYFNKYYYLN